MEKVFQKQTSMQEMFDKRRVSLKKLAAKQTRPVQPVAPRPEAFIKSPLSSPGQSKHRHTKDPCLLTCVNVMCVCVPPRHSTQSAAGQEQLGDKRL